MEPVLSIVLPAFNEEGNIERAVKGAVSAVAGLVPDYEIVVVDDGSRDRTPAILKELEQQMGSRLRVIQHSVNRGYGVALRNGFAATRGALVFYTDSDNQFDLTEIKDALPRIDDHDAVLGFRKDRQDPAFRLLVSAVFNALSSWLLGTRVRDINCSFKLFRGPMIRDLLIESADFFVDTEMVARMQRAGWRLSQQGVRHLPRIAGRSSVRPGDVPRTLLSMVRMWFKLRRSPART